MAPTRASASPSPSGEPSVQATEAPDLQARILVQNATSTDGLAGNAVDRLQQAGFPNVGAAQSPETGSHPTSSIINYSGSDATARQISELLGIPATYIHRGDQSLAGEHDLVVILGGDAPPPGG
jgi:hypothetical protein